MNEQEWLAARFEAERTHLRAVAFRMLGSLSDADDAVQEGWLRLSRSGADDVDNLGAWLTTVVARVCLNMLRSRTSRREESLEVHGPETGADRRDGTDPEHEAILADSVGLALLVVLETLTPAERLAFVLHDTFEVPFDEIAPIVGRSPAAARQLASRARRRVRGSVVVPHADISRQRAVVDAFLAASRSGDFEALLAVLDPDVILHVDATAVPQGSPREIRGAAAVAKGAVAFASRAQFAQPALVNGEVGVIMAPRGRLFGVGILTIRRGRITAVDLVADPERLRRVEIAVLIQPEAK
jgi:RNA polymerase sigma factor (sigma-70 family)